MLAQLQVLALPQAAEPKKDDEDPYQDQEYACKSNMREVEIVVFALREYVNFLCTRPNPERFVNDAFLAWMNWSKMRLLSDLT